MRNKFFIVILFAITINGCFGQTDTVYSNNKKIPCVVKEITPDYIKYSYAGEDLLNSIYKNTVQKIVFKNGRVQTFAAAASLKKVKSTSDFENVSITQLESEVKGLFKLGEVGSKAKGTTTLSNRERVKQRAYRKFKMQAAMMGANIVYITTQQTEGNKYGGYYQAGSTTETSLTGIAYSNEVPDFEKFKKLIQNRKNFLTIQKTSLSHNATKFQHFTDKRYNFKIYTIHSKNGLITIDGKLEGVSKHSTFRVVSFNDTYFIIYYKNKNNVYNIKIAFKH